MQIVALAGGVGAGKFLRGVDRAFPGELTTVVVNTGDDIDVHGLHVSPDLDSVCYWLAGLMDRERGWGRAGETFNAMDAMRTSGAIDAWFNLGDRDLAMRRDPHEALQRFVPHEPRGIVLGRVEQDVGGALRAE